MSAPFSKKVLSEVLAGLSRVAAEGDGETLQRLYLVLANKRATTSRSPAKQPAKKSSVSTTNKELFESDEELRERLYAFESREALSNFLDEKFPRKSDIIAVSKVARVAVNKNDDYDALVERLIDATIGYKLRSRAIRGDG